MGGKPHREQELPVKYADCVYTVTPYNNDTVK